MDDESTDAAHVCEDVERYTSLFTHHPHASYSVDRLGYYTDANPVSLALTGLSLEEFKRTHFSDVVHAEDVHIIQDAFELALAGEPNLAEARVVHTDGQVFDIRCTLIPLVVRGEVVGVHGVTEDITDARKVLRDLEDLNHQLEEANAAKALFLANVSHEVRTPLTSILAAGEILKGDATDPEATRLVDVVHRNSERLLHLMNDILDFSQLAANRVTLRSRPFEVRESIEGVAEWAVPLARSRGLTTSFVVDDSVPVTLVGDARRVEQVITNLVQNAIDFTERGGIEMQVSCRTAAPDPCDDCDAWVEFRVTDTGIGVAQDRLPDLFDAFTQDNPDDMRSYRGVGLGLAICRDLAALMGGQLHATSEVGVGSVFTFSVPVGPCSRGVSP